MTKIKINPKTWFLLLVIFAVALLRVATSFSSQLEPLALFTPIGAMALFGGTYFTGYVRPFAFPLLALFISDVILSFTVMSPFRVGLLYTGWFWTYLAFALMTLAGKLIITTVTFRRVLYAIMVSTVIHWLVSDIGGCLHQGSLSASIAVYFQRLGTAIPYEFRFFAGADVYACVMFGTVESNIGKKHLPETPSQLSK